MTFFLDVLPASLAAAFGATAGAAGAATGAAGVLGTSALGLIPGVGIASSAAGTALGAAGAGISAATILGGITTIGGALAQVGQGAAQAESLRVQAAQMRAQSDQETARGAESARQAAREVAQIRGTQDVMFLANGLDIGIGTPINVAEATGREADRQLANIRANARNRSAMRRLRSMSLSSEASAALSGGFFRGAGTLAKGAQVLL